MAAASAERVTSNDAVGQAPAPPGAARAVVLLIVGLLILWAWSHGLSGPFHFDDYVTPLNDPASQSLAAWGEQLSVTLRPVTKLTYALEAEAGLGSDPALRRLVSIVFLTASAVLLALLAARLAPSPGCPGSASFVAGLVALLWLAHPVHADAVLLISGRTAVLSGLLLLAALLALEHRRSWLAGALFLLACLARETALAGVLPLTVLAASRADTEWRAALRRFAPVLLAAGLALAWILSTPRYLALAEFSYLGRPFWSSVAAQVGAVPVGLGLLFQPGGLSVDYGLPLPRRPSEPLFLLGVALYVAAAAGMLLATKRSRAVAVGLALWLAALLPTQSVVPKLDPLSNRPLGLALAGLLLAAAPILLASMRSIGPVRTPRVSGRRAVAAGLVAVLMLSLTSATARRAGLFQSELRLWRDAAAKSRTNVRPHLQYAGLLLQAGDVEQARRALAAALRIDPFNSVAARLARAPHFEELSP